MPCGRIGRWLIALLLVLDATSASAQQKQVLVLYSTRRDAQIVTVGDRELPRILERGLPEGLDYYSEFIDSARFGDTDYQTSFRDYLRLKFQGKRFDLLIAMDHLALEFLEENRLATSPIVFFSARAMPRDPVNATGVIGELNFAGSLAMALQLQPEVRQVFVVTGAGSIDEQLEMTARAQFQSFESRVAITYLTGLPTQQLEQRLASLPPHSIVYYVIVDRDGNNAHFNPLEYLDRIAMIANAPIYSWVDSAIDHGIVGGSLKSQMAEVEEVGKVALRVLNGERADDIPMSSHDLNVRQVDWRELQRWGIREDRLPAGTSVLFRHPTLFSEYRSYIFGTIGLVVLQTALIGGLVVQRRRRRRAEESLRESEQHFRLTADTAPVMIWRSGPDKKCDFFNKPWLTFRGRAHEQEIGAGWLDGVHPEDRGDCLRTYERAFDRREAFRMEFRLLRADGQYRWVLDTGVPRRMPDGTFSGYIGSCLDITERRESEEALRSNEAKLRASHAHIQDLAGRLISAQEAERSRIARELHDDLSQQLAVLTMELSVLRRVANHAQTQQLAIEILNRANGIAKCMHDLTHRLHPVKLQLLGLVDAIDALREELSPCQIPITFTHENVPAALPIDLRLCLFRVVQEGVQNAIKHSHARSISVHISGGEDRLTLTILDDGTGFDVDAAWRKGLGLISMSERLEAIGGSLEIRSTRATGTQLDVTVPLTHAAKSTMEAQADLSI